MGKNNKAFPNLHYFVFFRIIYASLINLAERKSDARHDNGMCIARDTSDN